MIISKMHFDGSVTVMLTPQEVKVIKRALKQFILSAKSMEVQK